MRSTPGLSQLRPGAERIISAILSPTGKSSICRVLPLLLGIKTLDCDVKSQLDKDSIIVRAMYVSRHKNKFIKSAQTPQRRRPVIDFQNEIVEMYVRREGEEEGVENGRGRRFIKWVFDKRLRANQAAAIMRKLRQNINQTFYIRYSYSYVLVNNETGLEWCFINSKKARLG